MGHILTITLCIFDYVLVSCAGARVEPLKPLKPSGDLQSRYYVLSWIIPDDYLYQPRQVQRSLRCLNEFLGRQKVWVVQPYKNNVERLYVSATVSNLGGTVWKIKMAGSQDIVCYDLESGFIILVPDRN